MNSQQLFKYKNIKNKLKNISKRNQHLYLLLRKHITKSLKINKPDYHIILYKPESLYYIYIKEHLFPDNLPLHINIIPCNFHFISVVVKSNIKETNITSFLFNRTNNHYISNMILFDKSFNNYISTNLLSTTESDINEIHIIDNMANNFVLNADQHIFLYSDSYTIINKSK